jgi:hypothetical protein
MLNFHQKGVHFKHNVRLFLWFCSLFRKGARSLNKKITFVCHPICIIDLMILQVIRYLNFLFSCTVIQPSCQNGILVCQRLTSNPTHDSSQTSHTICQLMLTAFEWVHSRFFSPYSIIAATCRKKDL